MQTQTKRGFNLRCPRCGEETTQLLDLDDLTTIHCDGCEDSYTLDDIRELVAAWSKLLAWIDLAPTAEG